MKKKILIKIILIFIFIITILIFIKPYLLRLYFPTLGNKLITLKAYLLFGNNSCKGHPFSECAGMAFTDWTCYLCGYSDTNSNTNVPTICGECAKTTKRCTDCGKFESFDLHTDYIYKDTYVPETNGFAF